MQRCQLVINVLHIEQVFPAAFRCEALNRIKPGRALVQILGFGIRPALAADVQFLALDAHIRSRRHGHGNKGVAADDGVVTDNGFTAQNRSAGINCNVVFNSGMTLFAAQILAAPGRQRADGNALVDFHVVADDGSFAHYDAGAVIDKKEAADGGAGMDVDTGFAMGIL